MNAAIGQGHNSGCCHFLIESIAMLQEGVVNTLFDVVSSQCKTVTAQLVGCAYTVCERTMWTCISQNKLVDIYQDIFGILPELQSQFTMLLHSVYA